MNWYLVRDGQQYGPYDRQAMQDMIAQGRLSPADMVWAEGSPNWVPAAQAGFLWPSQAPPAAVVPPGKRQRRFGCLGCLGTLILIPVLLIGGLVLWLKYKDSGNMGLGSAATLASATVPSTGGSITIGKPGSPLNGMSVSVSAEAYGKDLPFRIQATEITSHQLGPLFHPATPLITIDNGHVYSNDPMAVKIPVSIARDEFALGFYYDRKTGKLEGLPLVGEDAQSITILTRHFSDLVISKAKKAEIVRGLPAASGYLPGVDDWQFTNFGSWLAPAGHCAGQSITSMWYYLEKKQAAGERALYGRYDNNDYGMGTIQLQEDDSWGYRFASMVQSELDWDSLSRRIVRKINGFPTGLTWFAFAYSIQLTGEPQYIEIWGQTTDAKGQPVEAGHAMVVYKADASGLYIADPNYHGNENRRINLANGELQPYNSGLNRAEIDKGNGISFPILLYIGKTAIADWGKVGARYAEIAAGTIGNDKFPKWKVRYLIQEGADKKWPEVPKVIKTDEVTTMLPGAGLKGMLRFEVKFPYTTGAAEYRVDLFKDTTLLANGAFDGRGEYYYNFSLDKGVNNLGFYYYKVDADGKAQYIDFKRVRILYGDDDLSGTWNGEMTVRGTEVFRKHVEDLVVIVLRAFLPDRSEADLRGAAAASIKMNVETNPFSFVLTKRAQEEGKYDFSMEYRDKEGQRYGSTGIATYKDGVLTWRAKAEDRSTADYQGNLLGKEALKGTIDINAWGVMPNAATSEWHAQRAKR
ncbi:DUF4339 domain-containing protein [Paludibaculum fermentans]|uniref:DUF4339 domain-containing protein n=1 Tax=Paludibaculum fermentans TaxID=1473598 RepID=A0A7S7SNB0_PALFE|nr:DUF4339 domain-containing protein [Paludibaculum fermentans]QOY91269.1 DUF4339 domain-containing protein [Paludibaculum fermentans]